MVKSRLGPGTWMNRIDATRNATHWLDDGMTPVWGRAAARVSGISAGDRPDAMALPSPPRALRGFLSGT